MRYTVKLCPKCNAQIGNRSSNRSMIISMTEYGSPFERCWNCNRKITRNDVYEPALFLSKKDKLPFFLTNKLVLVPVIFLYALLVTCFFIAISSSENIMTYMFSLLIFASFITLVWAGLSALLYSHRKQSRDEIIDESKERIKNDINYCFSAIYLYLSEREEEIFKTITQHEANVIHKNICKFLDEDKIPPFHACFDALEKIRSDRICKTEE